MTSVYPTSVKRIWHCFVFSLGFAVVIPTICIVLGVELHPSEFDYGSDLIMDTKKISLKADLISVDLKRRAVVLDWMIVDDTCEDVDSDCTSVNKLFCRNLLQRSNIYMNSSNPPKNNKPSDPTFIWNVTAEYHEEYSDYPIFQTAIIIFNPFEDFDQDASIRKSHYPISHTHTSNVYYPFDRYTALVFGFAEDANGPMNLHLKETSGLVGGLKITPEILIDPTDFAKEDEVEYIFVQILLQRSQLVVLYCFVITITFCRRDFLRLKK
ncbi:hypothetical protein EDD18DRAFT_1356321 [Armillaria luteobubalina]|uniref:Uncharacterized protein n=1 Tax=Armillaria luteobubalina TaxID=153913 RepID=A0AA39Q0G4_9AGAR|nr:hypothetical protein EDD18DRAFT_1356321 [Armillaria luteobubalina]